MQVNCKPKEQTEEISWEAENRIKKQIRNKKLRSMEDGKQTG